VYLAAVLEVSLTIYNKWKYQLLHSSGIALDWLFPPACGGCSRPGTRWCPDCQKKVQVISGALCSKCGLPHTGSRLCERCEQKAPGFKVLRSWAIFDNPLQGALHRLKYRRDIGMGIVLADQMLAFIRQLDWPVDTLLPIPLGKKRLKERGYNQVAMVAIPLSIQLGLDYHPTALVRARETRSQVGLSANERQDNVRDAFFANKKKVIGRNILLVDDVSTTGATLSSAAEVLYAAGAREVYALTVARALPRHGYKTV
jgi:ComF family protein